MKLFKNLFIGLVLGTATLPTLISPAVASGDLAVFTTRKDYYINAYDSTGNVRAQRRGNTTNVNASDEIFRLLDLNGGSLKSGDKLCIKTRKGYYINAYDSTGNVRAQRTGNCSDVNASDEIFTIYKVDGSGRIRSGDKVYLKTRKGYYINAYDSTGDVRAQRTGNTTNVNASDEIFTIYFR